jgi:tetratricopeptide (TPR) repeat protein
MSTIPKFLVESIYAGNCVLWIGSRLSAILDVPAWPELLEAGLSCLGEEVQEDLRKRIAQGDLVGVLAAFEQHGFGEELGAVLDDAEARAAELPFDDDGDVFGAMPWRATLASVYPGVVARALAAHKGDTEIVSAQVALGQIHSDLLTYAVVAARPTAGSLRSAATELELVQELLHTRSLLMVGFSIDDPDFVQALDFLHMVESESPRWVCLPAEQAREAARLPAMDHAGLSVLPDDKFGIGEWMHALAREQTDGEDVEAATHASHDAFEIAGAVRDLPLRLEISGLQAASRPLPSCLARRESVQGDEPMFNRLDVDALHQVAGLLAAHGRSEDASRILSVAYERTQDQPRLALAAFGQALLCARLGDHETSAQALALVAEHDPNVLPVPDALKLLRVSRWDLAELVFECMALGDDAEAGAALEVATVRIEGSLSAERQRQFAAAAQQWSELEHAGLQPILQYFSDARRAGVVGVQVPGPTLELYLEHHGGALETRQALELLAPVAQALAEAHERGLHHGFISPRTIVVAAEGAVLAGIALASLAQPVHSLLHDRAAYIAPERIAASEASAKADVFALAAVMWRICLGCEPSVSATIEALAHDGLGPVALAISSGLARVPEARPNVDEFWNALVGALSESEATSSISEEQVAEESTQPRTALRARGRRVRGRAAPRRDAMSDKTDRLPVVAHAISEGTHDAGDGDEAGVESEVAAVAELVEVVESAPTLASAETPVPAPAAPTLPANDDLEGWLAVLAARPFDLRARQAIEQIGERARKEEAWDRLADVLLARAEHTQVKLQRVALLRELADVFADKLDVPANAFDVLRSAVADVPEGEVESYLQQICTVGESIEMWTELAESLTALSDRTSDRKVRAAIYRKLANVQEVHLRHFESARTSNRLSNELVPGDLPTLEALVRLDQELGDAASLAQSLAELAQAQPFETAKKTKVRQVQVLQQELGDAQAALAVIDELLASEPGNAEWLGTAEALARACGNDQRLLEVLYAKLEHELAQARGPVLEEVAALELARGHGDEAARAWTQILEEYEELHWAQTIVGDARWLALAEESPLAADNLVRAYDRIAAHASSQSSEFAQALLSAAQWLERRGSGRADEVREGAVRRLREGLASLSAAEPLSLQISSELARLLLAMDRIDDAQDVWRARASSSEVDSAAQAQAWQKILDINTNVRPDPVRRREALQQLVDLQPERVEWVTALAAIDEEAGNVDHAKTLLIRLLDVATGDERRDLLRRLYALTRHESPREARTWLAALVEDSTDARSEWLELAELDHELGDFAAEVNDRIAAARTLADAPEKQRELFEIALRACEEPVTVSAAHELLHEVAQDPHAPREALVQWFARCGEDEDARAWSSADHRYAMATTWTTRAKAEGAEKSELAQSFRTLARLASELGKDEEARAALRIVTELEPRHASTLADQIKLDLNALDHAAALVGLRRLLTLPDFAAWSNEAKAVVHRQVAECYVADGQHEAALESLGQALRLAPFDESALRLRLELLSKWGVPVDVVKAQMALIESLEKRLSAADSADADAQRLAEEIAWLRADAAKLMIDPLGRPAEAVTLLRRAIDLLPGDLGLLHRQLDASSAAEDWHSAVDVLTVLAEQQTTPELKAKYFFTAGALLRDQANDMASALPWLKKTLELEPLHEKAFSGLIAYYHGKGEWSRIAEAIGVRVAALSEQQRVEKVGLYEQLASIYERHLGDPKAALAAYEQGIRLAGPEQEVEVRAHRRRKVMGLNLQVYGEAGLDSAIAHGLALMAIKPLDVDVYRRVLELCQQAGRVDQAVSIARVLRFLKKANNDEIRLAGSVDGPVPRAKASLSRDLWRKHLCHSGEKPQIGELLALIWPVIVARAGRTYGHLGLDRQNRTPISTNSRGVLGLIGQTCQTLDMALPDVFEQPSSPDGFVATALSDRKNVYPTILVGSDVMHERSEPVLAFRTARALARVRPEAVAVRVLPSPGSLRDAVAGAVLLSGEHPNFIGESQEFANVYAREIKRLLPPARIENLRMVVDRVLAAGEFDAAEYIRGVEFSAARVGLLLSGSLDASAMALARSRDETSFVPVPDLVRDLIGFSVSDGYFQLREALGLSLADEMGLPEMLMKPRRSAPPPPPA